MCVRHTSASGNFARNFPPRDYQLCYFATFLFFVCWCVCLLCCEAHVDLVTAIHTKYLYVRCDLFRIEHIGVTAQECAFKTPHIAALVLFSIAQIGVIAQGCALKFGTSNDFIRFPYRHRSLDTHRSLGTLVRKKSWSKMI